MPLPIIALIALIVVAVGTAVYALVRDHERRTLLDRAGANLPDASVLLRPRSEGLGSRFVSWLAARAPESLGTTGAEDELVQAGFEHAAAPALFGLARVASAVVIPAAILLIAPRRNTLMFVATLVVGVLIGLVLPRAYIARRVRLRQERLRRAIPDSLDLLVVCVEAGISLDAAIVRVARDMAILHPDLANELLIVHRRVNAGIPRDRALHGLWQRTGVEDLRGLAANMIQSEKWGTSIATVLRVYAESLRRKRKQLAEKRAATAPLKMMVPLAVFIFPAIFIVLLGPAMIRISAMFGNLAR